MTARTTRLQTPRLLLRRLQENDVPWLMEMDGDPEVMRYITLTPCVSEEATRAWIHSQAERYEKAGTRYGFFAVESPGTGEAMGWMVLRPALDYRFAAEVEFKADELELGYRFRRRFWGQGFATEGARALVEYGFADPSVRAIVAVALATNQRSLRVMAKAGMVRGGEYLLPGFDTPAVTCSLVRPPDPA